MKSTIIFILMCIILLNPVSSLIAGTSNTVMSFSKCVNLIVEVKGNLNIDTGEYWFENCTETLENKWLCECYDNYNLILSTDIRTINDYNFSITYKYELEESTPIVHRKTSSWINWYYPEVNEAKINETKVNEIKVNKTEIIEIIKEKIINETDEIMVDKNITDIKIVQEKDINYNIYYWIIGTIGIIGVVIIKRRFHINQSKTIK